MSLIICRACAVLSFRSLTIVYPGLQHALNNGAWAESQQEYHLPSQYIITQFNSIRRTVLQCMLIEVNVHCYVWSPRKGLFESSRILHGALVKSNGHRQACILIVIRGCCLSYCSFSLRALCQVASVLRCLNEWCIKQGTLSATFELRQFAVAVKQRKPELARELILVTTTPGICFWFKDWKASHATIGNSFQSSATALPEEFRSTFFPCHCFHLQLITKNTEGIEMQLFTGSTSNSTPSLSKLGVWRDRTFEHNGSTNWSLNKMRNHNGQVSCAHPVWQLPSCANNFFVVRNQLWPLPQCKLSRRIVVGAFKLLPAYRGLPNEHLPNRWNLIPDIETPRTDTFWEPTFCARKFTWTDSLKKVLVTKLTCPV